MYNSLFLFNVRFFFSVPTTLMGLVRFQGAKGLPGAPGSAGDRGVKVSLSVTRWYYNVN